MPGAGSIFAGLRRHPDPSSSRGRARHCGCLAAALPAPGPCPGGFPDQEITSYTEAVQAALSQAGRDASANVLVTHQFVTGAAPCESEEFSVGGAENVDASAFDGFDYVALGHIHCPQNLRGSGMIRYCGTPLAYSVSEAGQEKSVTLVELGAPREP
ncbi:MAG: hypothetical protein V8Q30_05565 [Acutalibacteraceae bacterium]